MLDARVRRVAGHLLDPEMPVGNARDLRKVRDREHLRALGETLQRRGDGVRRHAADAGVDLVEDERLSSRDSREGEGDARQLAAGGGLRDGGEGQSRVRTDEERRLVCAGRAGIAIAELDEELSVPHSERRELVGDRLAEASGRALTRVPQLGAEGRDAALTVLDLPARRLDRIAAAGGRGQLAIGLGCAGEQIVVRGRREAPLEVSDRLEPLLDALERAGLRVERRHESVEVAPHLAQTDGEVAQLLGARRELGCDALERRDRALGERGERCCALALVWRDRSRGVRSGLRQLVDVPEALATGEQLSLVPRFHAFRRVDQRLQLGEARRDGGGVAREGFEALPRGYQVAPRAGRIPSALELVGAAEGVEDVERIRGSGEPSLLELARHRDQPLDSCSDVLARDSATPRISPRAPVAEHAARDHEARLAVRAKLGDTGQLVLVEEALRDVELGLDIGLGTVAADRRGVRARSQQEPDGLREDRLARTGLARDGVEAGVEGQLRLADENEILDP